MRRKNSALVVLVVIAAFARGALASQGKSSQRSAQERTSASVGGPVPAPRDAIGFTPGDDRKLASWAAILDYFKKLDKASDRITFQDLGKTTLGRPFVLAIISSPANLARLDRFREIQRKLSDPRLINSNDVEAEKLIAEGRTIVLITCGIHSTEVGSNLVAMNIAHKLASDDSPETREILDKCIILLVPSLNPDGVDIVKDWYDKTLGTPAEGTGPPELYHHYTGHDNNRDWYAFTQVETQLTVDRVHNAWHPQIVHDIHQQGESGTRFFLPPYTEPWEPNVPPIIQAGVNFMGTSMAWELAAEGKKGVVINGVYDAWTPARAYQHYHGGIRILSETASARIASPTSVEFARLTPQINVNPKVRSWNFPLVWPGGEWKLAHIVDYMQAGAFALMRNAARYRERWLRGFYQVGRDAVRERRPGEPFAYIIPPLDRPSHGSWEKDGFDRLISILERGQVEVREAAAEFEADGAKYPAGSRIVLMAQPYGAFAKTLLERQQYPDLREYPGGPPRRPYDVTAHTLPLLMGVKVVETKQPFGFQAGSVTAGQNHKGLDEAMRLLAVNTSLRVGIYKSSAASMDEGWTRWVLDQYRFSYSPVTDAEVRAGTLELKLVARDTQVPYSSKEQAEAAAKAMPPGEDPYTAQWETVYYRDHPGAGGSPKEGWVVVSKRSVVSGLDMRDVSPRQSEFAPAVYELAFSLTPDGAKRLSEATGKHVGEQLALVLNKEVRSAFRISSRIDEIGQLTGNFTKKYAEDLAGRLLDLRAKFDCIIIPSQGAQQIFNGLSSDRYPAEIAGGLGESGVDALKKFIELGGTVITLNEASQFAIEKLGVPVKNVLEGVPAREFYCPGSILRIKFEPSNPLTKEAPPLVSTTDQSVAWFEAGPAFETTSEDARVVARFGDAREVLLSGWLLGAEKIANKAAIVEVKRGNGRIVMFAFRPQYRGQSIATFPFLFNAILTSAVSR